MTDDTMAFFNLVRERGGGDLLKDLAEAVLQQLMTTSHRRWACQAFQKAYFALEHSGLSI